MEVLFLLSAVVGLAVLVVICTRLILQGLVPERMRVWAWAPVAAVLLALPFVDEVYNEQQTRLACRADGGFVVRKQIAARSLEAGMALIETRRFDSEMPHFWRHDFLFLYRPTGEELGRLRWFDRKGGWLRGKRPGSGLARYFRPAPCPDPQSLLEHGAARRKLVQVKQ